MKTYRINLTVTEVPEPATGSLHHVKTQSPQAATRSAQ